MKFFSQQLSRKKKERLFRRIRQVVDSEEFIGGPEVAELERRLTAYFGVPTYTCNSGTDALMLGLKALDLGPGDEIITTAFTYFATIEAIAAVGATPVLVDIDPETYNLDPKLIEKKVTKRTKAVLVVHLYGLACDMKPIVGICNNRGLKLIEDCAQSLGAKSGGRLTGTFGDLGCFSFFPTKNLGAFGDGGAVTIRSKTVAKRFRLLKNHGQPKKYVHNILGYNSRLDALQASILNEKLAWLEDDLKIRKSRAAAWQRKFAADPNVLCFPDQPGHTYNVFTLLVRDREAFRQAVERENIPSAVYYDRPVYRQRAYINLFGTHKPLTHSEFASKHVVSLPVH